MLKLKSMWPQRRFRCRDGYMLTIDSGAHMFMVPHKISDRFAPPNQGFDKIEIELLVGVNKKLETTYCYVIHDEAMRTSEHNDENLQKAAQWAMEQALRDMDEKANMYRRITNNLQTAITNYNAYPGQNGG